MLATNMAQTSGKYGSPVSKAPREIEYDLFARITRALQKSGPADQGRSATQAVVDNSQLWIELAADLAHPANDLPDELKRQLLSLAMYSIRHGNRILAGQGDSSVLVDINLSIMKGLGARRAG